MTDERLTDTGDGTAEIIGISWTATDEASGARDPDDCDR